MKYAVLTFGCRVNQADSLRFEEELLAHGGQPVSPEDADLVVVNTCSVTASADQAARQTIRRMTRLNPDVKVVVSGCYATRRPDEVSALPNVVQVIANDDKPRFLPLVLQRAVELGLTTSERFGDGVGSCGALIRPGVAGRTAFTLRVQTGCAQPCSYCIIPTTRGVPRSVRLESVLQEIDRAYAGGFREIALTGVHLGSYGRDLSPASSLTSLLEMLAIVSSERWQGLLFRISSLEPMDCAPDVVALVARSSCFAAHFHLPLQHASNRVLTLMRRPYSIEYYATLVDEIRRSIPNASIGSDLIAGFPGESDEDFASTIDYLESSPLTHLHVFPYSDRPGTVAADLPDKIAPPLIRERASRLRDVGARLATRFRRSQVGTEHRALTLEDGTLAVTGNYLKVRIPPGRERNQWVTLRVAGTEPELRGDVLARESVENGG